MEEKKKFGIVGMVFAVVILVGVGILILWTSRPANVNIADNAVQITGAYGAIIYFSDIQSIVLLEESMREIGPGRRRNGTNVGDTLRGRFDAGLLFVRNAEEGPTIRIDRHGDSPVFISLDESGDTRGLYMDLLGAANFIAPAEPGA